MSSKLYVTNLPNAPSTSALREYFGACGLVSDVRIVPDRNGGLGRASALVEMGSPAEAQRALTKLNGAPFGGRLLLVEIAPDDSARERSPGRRAQATDADVAARITQQYREPANMAYELDCGGVALIVRIFFRTPEGEWRIAAQSRDAAEAKSMDFSAGSRVEALRKVASACREAGPVSALGRVDWDAVERALVTVRAV